MSGGRFLCKGPMMSKRYLLLIAAVVASSMFGAAVNASEDFRVIANVDAIVVGKVGIGVRGFMVSAIKQSEATVTFEPRTNQASLAFSAQGVKNRLYLGQLARSTFIDAVVRYRDDFDQRKLSLKAKKTDRLYGFAKGKLEWGGITINKYSLPRVDFGYIFVDRKHPKPYFSITIQKADNLGSKVDGVEFDNESVKTVIFFTKNQATELAEMLLQEKLEGLLAERGIIDYSEEPDVYKE